MATVIQNVPITFSERTVQAEVQLNRPLGRSESLPVPRNIDGQLNGRKPNRVDKGVGEYKVSKRILSILKVEEKIMPEKSNGVQKDSASDKSFSSVYTGDSSFEQLVHEYLASETAQRGDEKQEDVPKSEPHSSSTSKSGTSTARTMSESTIVASICSGAEVDGTRSATQTDKVLDICSSPTDIKVFTTQKIDSEPCAELKPESESIRISPLSVPVILKGVSQSSEATTATMNIHVMRSSNREVHGLINNLQRAVQRHGDPGSVIVMTPNSVGLDLAPVESPVQPIPEIKLFTPPMKGDDSLSTKSLELDSNQKEEQSQETIPPILPKEPQVSTTAELDRALNALSIDDSKAGPEPILIAHNRSAVARMDEFGAPWGVQYEIARGVSNGLWTWEQVTGEKLELLKGSNAEKATIVAEVFGLDRNSVASFAMSEEIAAELDREQSARIENKGRGLGLCGVWEGKEDWYGGRIQQIVRISRGKNEKGFAYSMGKLELGRSNRATRFAGSRSILQIRIDSSVNLREGGGAMSVDQLARRHVLCGRVFHPFHSKDNKVYLFECNEDFERAPREEEGDGHRLSWADFLRWHNPLELNSEQAISKWSTRWQLVLSTSKPALEFDPENIFFIDDIYANGSTDTIMTDGCGFINWSALVAIANGMNAERTPIVIHGRLAGAKGLWILHPEACHRQLTEPPMIWIRKSQNKIKLPPLADVHRSHRILDLVRLPRLTIPSSLYQQTIVNMSFNGVPDDAFINLLEGGLKREIEPLTTWEGNNSRAQLGRAVEYAGKLVGGRRSRQVGIEARVYGTIFDEFADADSDISADDIDNRGLIQRDRDSGYPASIYEICRELLQAGFSPLGLPLLRDKLKFVVKSVTDRFIEQYHISVPNSVEAFIAPDPFGVLEEGEIYFRSTESIGESASSVDPNTFIGPVLVTRNPTRVASDIQKVTAVHKDELLPYVNVILFSIKGTRSLASYLGGGDYDGDTVTIIADRTIVDPFQNPAFVSEPADLRDSFQREIEKVSSVLRRLEVLSPHEKEYQLSKTMLTGLSDSKVGIYSYFHDNAVYSKGYDHPATIRLAYMFCTCLDSSKTGLRLKDNVFREDSRKYNTLRPACMQKKEQLEKAKPSDKPLAARPKHLGTFVLDAIHQAGKSLRDQVLMRYEKLCGEKQEMADEDLLRPYKVADELARRVGKDLSSQKLSEELKEIRLFVQYIFDKYSEERKATWSITDPAVKSNKRRQVTRRIVAEYTKGPKGFDKFYTANAREVMASYAYRLSSYRAFLAEFPFEMAHKELCAIKASNYGPVSVTHDFADYLMTHGPLIRTLAKSTG